MPKKAATETETVEKQTVAIPPVFFISAAPTAMSSHTPHDGVYNEHAAQRLWGLFQVKDADGIPSKILEIAGNVGYFHTCCGGLRISAITHFWHMRNTWGESGCYINNNYSESRRVRWSFLIANPNALPDLSVLTGVSDEQLMRDDVLRRVLGHATAAAGVKQAMLRYVKALCVGMDRKDGRTSASLSTMSLLDRVNYYQFLHIAQSVRNNVRTARVDAFTDYSFPSRDNTRRSEGLERLRVHVGPGTRNLNSGNTIHTLSIQPSSSVRGSGLKTYESYKRYKFVSVDNTAQIRREYEKLRALGDISDLIPSSLSVA